jgi:hypothetical protein
VARLISLRLRTQKLTRFSLNRYFLNYCYFILKFFLPRFTRVAAGCNRRNNCNRAAFNLKMYLLQTRNSQHFDAYYYYFNGVLQHLTNLPTLRELDFFHAWPHYYNFLSGQFTGSRRTTFAQLYWKSAELTFFILVSFRYFLGADTPLVQYHLFQLFFWLNSHTTRGCAVYVGKPCRGQRTHTNAKSAFYVLPQLKLFVQKLKLLNKLDRRARTKHWTERDIKRLKIDKRLQKIDMKVKKKHAKPHKLTIKKKSKSVWN